VNREAGEVVAHAFTLTRVKARSYLYAQGADGADERPSAADCASWPVENAQRTVAHHLDDSTAVRVDVGPQDGLVAVKHTAPTVIAALERLAGRTDDVSEENRGKYALDTLGRRSAGDQTLDVIDYRREQPLQISALRRGGQDMKLRIRQQVSDVTNHRLGLRSIASHHYDRRSGDRP
jgi:hypothetical protein